METIADDIFHSIPTEGNGVQGVIERPLSDTSSDSGLDSQQILSPDLFDCITRVKMMKMMMSQIYMLLLIHEQILQTLKQYHLTQGLPLLFCQ